MGVVRLGYGYPHPHLYDYILFLCSTYCLLIVCHRQIYIYSKKPTAKQTKHTQKKEKFPLSTQIECQIVP